MVVNPEPADPRIPLDDRPPGPRNTPGCWIVTSLTAFIVFVLVIVGLFLPPINLYDRMFGPKFVPLAEPGESLTTTDQGFRLVAAAPSDDFGANL